MEIMKLNMKNDALIRRADLVKEKGKYEISHETCTK